MGLGWADCKATTICGLKFCQCARNMACWVETDTMPTKDDLSRQRKGATFLTR